MDEYLFQTHLGACKAVEEKTSSFEVFNYSDSKSVIPEEHDLADYELDDFYHQKGRFLPPAKRHGVDSTSSLRLVVQKDAKHAETFAPQVISLSAPHYESMVHTFRLPTRAIEGTSVVGPFFWSTFSFDEADPRFHIVFRKSDTRKQDKTEGWEVILSHSLNTGLTTGFVKGTASSHIPSSLTHIQRCASEIAHPFLLPLILLSHDLGARRDQQLRDTRDWVRKLERTISQRWDADSSSGVGGRKSVADVEDANRALVECQAQVLRKRPQDWLEIIRGVEGAMEAWKGRMVDGGKWSREIEEVHERIRGRLDFYRIKLRGIEGYAHTTMERLNIQRNALSSVVAHRDAIVNLQMVAMITDQRRIAQTSRRDANAMKRLSMLGAIFLPGTFIASLFSMVFFDVGHRGASAETGDAGGLGTLQVAPQLWIYFLIMIPLTVVVVASMWLWGRKRERRSDLEAAVLDEGLEVVEKEIVVQMRRQNARKTVAFEGDDESCASPRP